MIEVIIQKFLLLGNWTYLLIFLGAFLETAAFLGFLVPGETIVVMSGFLASQGVLELDDCLWMITMGAILGDNVSFGIGSVISRKYFDKHKRFLLLKPVHIERTQRYLKKHGGKTILFGRFIGYLRAFAPVTAGMAKMRYPRFLFFNLLGGILWTLTFTLLGFYFGKSWKVIEPWSGKIGVLIFFALIVCIVLSWTFHTLTKRQTDIINWIRGEWNDLQTQPKVKIFLAHHPKMVNFFKERLSPESYLGLHLTIGLTVSAVFMRLFSELAESVLEKGFLVHVDQWIHAHIQYLYAPEITPIMVMITHLANKNTIIIGTLLLALYFLLKKKYAEIAVTLTTVVGGTFLNKSLKLVIHRQRPTQNGHLISVHGLSFPSGHAMMSLIFYGLLAYFLIRERSSLRPWVLTGSSFVVFMIGFSRIYLKAHFLSDVIAGFCGGLFYLTLCITGLEIYRRSKTKQV